MFKLKPSLLSNSEIPLANWRSGKKNLIINVLLFLIIFLIPSNLFFKVYEANSYVTGLRVDYLIPKIYLSDILILGLLGIWILDLTLPDRHRGSLSCLPAKVAGTRRGGYPALAGWVRLITQKAARPSQAAGRHVVLLILFFLLIIRQFFTQNPIASFYYLFKIFEIGLLGIFLFKKSKIIKQKYLLAGLVSSLIFQSSLAIYQFIFQKSLFGFWFLGETNLSNYSGIAKGIFSGVEKILPYGTTAHPNILGGFLAIGIILHLSLNPSPINKRGKLVKWGITLLCLIALFLTQSFSAWLVLGIGACYYALSYSQAHVKTYRRGLGRGVLLFFILSPILINLFLNIFPNNLSFSRRNYLNQNAIKIFLDNPILGAGLNNFTVRVEEYGFLQESIRFVQPVHHAGLLILSETGILGIFILVFSFSYASAVGEGYLALGQIGRGVFLLIPILSLDHYLLTSQTGLLLLILFVFFYHQSPKKTYSASS